MDLKRFEKNIGSEDILNNKYFVSAYKLFSPVHLLKQPFKSDHNTLNKNFYKELLYIMGVEEIVDKETHKIIRLKENKQDYSLLEQTYAKLEDYSSVTDEEKRFETALGLVLIWVNRILFLKLLESQLKSFNIDTDVKFLNTEHINDYDGLNDLFFKVLAKPLKERSKELDMQFPNVPYLNSSLFEMSKIEETYFAVSGIRFGEMEIYKQTVLKDDKGRKRTGKIKTLDYFLSFLDAYDFGAEHSSENSLIHENSKTLINASVLGLIFEKINGYKDGSFFTPGYITQYICHKTLRRAVVDKFNKLKGWNCADFEDLKDRIEYGQREVRIEANQIINSIKICDPAVGSGHFLVSALNELIAIKSELGVLQDRQEQPKRIKDYDVRVEQDELVISDEDGDYFKYNPSDTTSQRIQEALFEEKQEIIENCLFGVDLNPKSVEICRLRLWIELLKNAYYYRNEDGKRVLQTLPNIDINIKCGNSLASNHPVCIGRKVNNIDGAQASIRDYKWYVREYKRCRSKALKRKVNDNITLIKSKLLPTRQYNLFEENISANFRDEYNIKKQTLEWMIEFPEVLSDDGTFEGFDVIIGNPPYINLEKLKVDSSIYASMHRIDEKGITQKTYQTHDSQGDLYTLFIEKGLHLLRNGGHLSYIVPNKWEKVKYGRPLRELFLNKNLYQLIDFGNNQIFEDATTYTCIIRMKKEQNRGTLSHSLLNIINPETLVDSIEECNEVFETSLIDNGIWTISSRYSFDMISKCKKQMSTLGKYVGGESYRGILTGLSSAFILSKVEADQIINKDVTSKKVLRPFLQGRGLKSYVQAIPGSFLIFIPKGFTAQGMSINRDIEPLPAEEKAWEWFKNSYPAISERLEPFKNKAKKRTDKGDYWWELRACAYYDKFAEPKIFYQKFQVKPCFIYDENNIFFNDSMWFLSVSDKSV
ncbi:Eco57I restriction-modification methylase domain-containing protein [Phocaeicola coprocola]|uniref:type IIG restriction enzyme/methyltransferase n=1 Tax=Phocaeicola coprocola TaxID=310298 RepID=UPI0022E63D8E|nr:Eco57I restriction-modification methylase domain-containing protein [Phocaeicola coprocola]